MKIKEIELEKNSLVYKAFDRIDYIDSFLVTFEYRSFKSIEEFAKAYFFSQPSWLRAVSQNSFSLVKIKKDIQTSQFQKDSKIGSWKIYDKDKSEIVFGEEMGFMEYRFSMRYQDKNKIQISTVVQINSFMGKYYFVMVKLLHKKFILISINRIKDIISEI